MEKVTAAQGATLDLLRMHPATQRISLLPAVPTPCEKCFPFSQPALRNSNDMHAEDVRASGCRMVTLQSSLTNLYHLAETPFVPVQLKLLLRWTTLP